MAEDDTKSSGAAARLLEQTHPGREKGERPLAPQCTEVDWAGLAQNPTQLQGWAEPGVTNTHKPRPSLAKISCLISNEFIWSNGTFLEMEGRLTTHVPLFICGLTLGRINFIMFLVMLKKSIVNCFQSVANINLQAVLNVYYCIYHNVMKSRIKS